MFKTVETSTYELQSSYNSIFESESDNPREAIRLYEGLIEQCKEEEDYQLQIDCLLRTTPLNMRQGLYTKALREGGSALQLINHHFPEDKYRLAYCYKELGAIYTNGFGKRSIALDYFFKAIKCDINDLNVNLYNNIGSLYKDAQLYDKALKYLEKGKSMAPRDSVIMVYILENLSFVYSALGKDGAAERLLREGIAVSNKVAKTDSTIYYIKGFVLNTLGELLHKLGRTNESVGYVNQALATAIKRNHTSIIVESLKNKGVFALALGDETGFEESIHKAIEYTKEETLSTLQISCLELLKKYHWDKEEYKEACRIANQIIHIKKQIDQTQENNSVVDLLEERESEIFLLENKNKMINRQKEELEQFAYIVAHDLKEPLRNIGGFGSLLSKRYSSLLDENGKEFLKFIVSSSTHMYSMLEDLLQYATVEHTESDLELIDPNKIVEGILYHAKDKLKKTNTVIEFSELVPVRIRKVHLNILFDNLIKNAIKFRDQERNLRIEINTHKKGDKIIFSIKDNGKGIDSKHHESIFQIFKRLEKNKHTGTGIGLSVCKKIVESYQGRIWVESEAGVGSTFFFSISNALK